MITVSYDEKHNAIIIEYSGIVDAAEAARFFSEIQTLVPKCRKGFNILADMSMLQVMAPETLETVKKAMDFFNAHGVEEIIRVIPDPSQDVGFSIMSLFHYSKEVKFSTVRSRKDAESHVLAWGPKRKIAFMEMKETWQQDFIRKKLSGTSIAFYDETFQEKAGELKDIHILSVFVDSRVEKKHIDQMPALECIATRSTGFDHIDLKAAQEKGITVCTVPLYGENTVAEHTFALILSLSRNLRKAYLQAAQNNFSLDGLMGFDLKGKTLGVIGTGHIGLHVIRIAIGFGMKVIAFDVKKQDFLAEVLNFEYVSFNDLLKRSDVITLHAPYMPQTHHLINQKNIGLIKKGAVLINTARGGLVETDALAEALDKKIISAAGLDVLEEKTHPVLKNENVIFTPHMAFCSYEAVKRILQTTVDNITAFSKGRPENTVSCGA